MNQVDIRVFLHHDKKVERLNEDNEWLAALLSGDALKKKQPKKINRIVSSSQRMATRGN